MGGTAMATVYMRKLLKRLSGDGFRDPATIHHVRNTKTGKHRNMVISFALRVALTRNPIGISATKAINPDRGNAKSCSPCACADAGHRRPARTS